MDWNRNRNEAVVHDCVSVNVYNQCAYVCVCVYEQVSRFIPFYFNSTLLFDYPLEKLKKRIN